MDRIARRQELTGLTDAELEARAVAAFRNYLDLARRGGRHTQGPLARAYEPLADCCYVAAGRGLAGFERRASERAREELAAERRGQQPEIAP